MRPSRLGGRGYSGEGRVLLLKKCAEKVACGTLSVSGPLALALASRPVTGFHKMA